MGNSLAISSEIVVQRIHLVRGQKVMLDRNLAELYGVRAIRLREQVKRNRARFPRNFMFQLSEKETQSMVSHFAIPSLQHLGGSLPFAFTEHGVLMLANVLKSDRAIKMSVRIIEIFVKLREELLLNKELLLKLDRLERNVETHTEEIQLIFKYIRELLRPPLGKASAIGFKRNKES